MSEERIAELAKEMILLNSLGEVITIQINLMDVENSRTLLEEAFVNSERDGIFINDMILIRVIEGELYDWGAILNKITEKTGNDEAIDSVTALIRVQTGPSSLEMTINISGEHEMPNLLQSSNNSTFFQLMNYVNTKWLHAKNSMRLHS